MKNKKYVWIIVFLYILFIFSNSLQIGETSSAISGGLTQFLLSILHSFGWNIPFDTFQRIRRTWHSRRVRFAHCTTAYKPKTQLRTLLDFTAIHG